MGMRVSGSDSPESGLSAEEVKGLYNKLGVSLKDLNDARRRFNAADADTPAAITDLIDSFKEFDTNRNDTLSISEMAAYARKRESSATQNSASFIGDSEGVSLSQLKVMREINKNNDVENENLNRLIYGFNQNDMNHDGLLDAEEYEKFARRKKVSMLDKKDDSSLEQTMFRRALTAYAQNDDAPLSFLVSNFVAEA